MEELKQLLHHYEKRLMYHYQFIIVHQANENINLLLSIIAKIKQDIIEEYSWTEEEIIEKINTGKVPDAIAYCYN